MHLHGQVQHLVCHICAVAVVLRRQVYQTLKGFDVAYKHGFWTDVDLAMRARQEGLDVSLQPLSIVYHHGGSNPLPPIPGDKQQSGKEWLMSVNSRVFRERCCIMSILYIRSRAAWKASDSHGPLSHPTKQLASMQVAEDVGSSALLWKGEFRSWTPEADES